VTEDAKFEDGETRPLRLRALDTEDLSVISGLCQDAVLPASEMRWQRTDRRLALFLNRFRWEDAPAAAARGRDVERVQAVLAIEDVTHVRSHGIPRGDDETVLSLLALAFEAGADGQGTVVLTFAGDGEIRAEVEALEVLLRDVTRPYRAPSGQVPSHDT